MGSKVSTSQAHTPTPWTLGHTPETSRSVWHEGAVKTDNVMLCVTHCDGKVPREEQAANARFIVTACNSHDELLEACKMILGYVEPCFHCDQTGKKPTDETSACEQCGGTAKLMKGSVISEIHILEAAIAKAEGRA